MVLTEALAAKYPFLSGAKKFLPTETRSRVSYEELESTAEAIRFSLENPSAPPAPVLSSAEKAVRQHALARLLLAALSSQLVSRRFARVRARQAVARLRSEEENVFVEVAKDFLPSLEAQPGGGYWISLPDFLRFGLDLVHANVEGGKVFVDKNDLLSLISWGIQTRLTDFAGVSVKKIPGDVREVVDELRENISKEALAPAAFKGFKGRYLNLPCVQRIRRGISEGKRYYGAMTLAVASVCDGLSKENAAELMSEYVANCSKLTHAFTEREGLNVVEWVYKHSAIRFSCRTMRENDLAGDYCTDCTYFRGRSRGTRRK